MVILTFGVKISEIFTCFFFLKYLWEKKCPYFLLQKLLLCAFCLAFFHPPSHSVMLTH